jgi:class 3 adenylate cyclase/CHASE2 domain-containing sensor protein
MSNAPRPVGKRNWRRWIISRVLTPLLYAVPATLVVASVQSVMNQGLIAAWERNGLGWLYLHRASSPPDPRVAVVAVDKPLFERQREAGSQRDPLSPPGKPLESYRSGDCGCGVPRRCYAEAVDRLARWGASATVLDLMFTRKCEVEDGRLRKAIEQAGNVILAAYANTVPLGHAGDITRISDVQVQLPVFADVGMVASPVVQPRDQEYALELRQTVQNMETGEFQELNAMAWEAVALVQGQNPDDTAPWAPYLVDGTQPRLLGNLFSSGAEAAPTPGGGGVTFKALRGSLQVDEIRHRKHLLVNFSSGSQEDRGRYPLDRLSWVLSCSEKEGKARFAGKIVLIGDPATDQHRTLVGAMPGTEVLANATATLLQRRPVRFVPAGWILLTMFAASLLTVLLIRETPWKFAVAGILLLAFGQMALSLELLHRNWWMLPFSPLAAMVLAGGAISLWQNKGFQGQVAQLAPPRIARLAEQVGGFQVQEASVLFSDIRGYTTISETMDPAEVLTYLNRYMSTVDDILDRYEGTFVSCPGDCVVALFQEERTGPHRERAIMAGLEMVRNAARFAAEWKRETGLDFAVGIGINSGPMAIGMMEARRRVQPNIIGDAVNTAARVESLTKEHGQFLVTEETLAPVRDRFEAEFADEVALKGRAQAVRVHRILGMKKAGRSEQKGLARLLARIKRTLARGGSAPLGDTNTL